MEPVFCVESILRGQKAQSIALQNARKEIGNLKTWARSLQSASFAETNFSPMEDRDSKPVLGHVVLDSHGKNAVPISIESAGNTDVYCLDVDDPSHSFAVCGGILVHNCYDEVCHICMARPLAPEKPKQKTSWTDERLDMLEKGSTGDDFEDWMIEQSKEIGQRRPRMIHDANLVG